MILEHIRIRRLLWPLAIRAVYPAGLPGGSARVIHADGLRITAKKHVKKLLNNLQESFNLRITLQKSPNNYHDQHVRKTTQLNIS
ncbi:MAG: hypothetical protein CVV41_15870 [Candidatus Riflebacteria bacterium HGW-Riflebacteria-1]|nr:MAG: hypothetical protein CVV41_15870 [Candidatus Riflebacteria bacterium HGW-Riflebacteria-1]